MTESFTALPNVYWWLVSAIYTQLLSLCWNCTLYSYYQYHTVTCTCSPNTHNTHMHPPPLPHTHTKKAEPDKDVIYQNTDTMEPPLPHRSKSPADGPIVPTRTNHGYINVQPGDSGKVAVKTNGQPSAPPKPPKKPSPPTKRRDPVARKPSTGISNNGEKEQEPAQKESKNELMYENMPSTKVAPVPRPKPRARHSDPRPVSPQVPTSPRPVSPSPQQRPLPSIPLTSTPVKKDTESDQEKKVESVYSTVDTSQFTDTGPEIKVVDVSSGKAAPLSKVEVALETSDQLLSSANTSKTSILDTVSV